MKLVFLGENDWANSSNAIVRAINRAGGDVIARVVTVRPHKFGYDEDVVIERDGEQAVREAVKGTDWIVHSGDGHYDVFARLLRELAIDRSRVRLATKHAGTRYRNDPAKYDGLDREWGFERRFLACDLYRFTVDDPRARVFVKPHDRFVDGIGPVGGPVRICHSPSRRATKGTETILALIDDLRTTGRRFEFELIEGIGFRECERRRASHHILVDQIHPFVGGFGAAVTEAMAQGLAVVSHCGNVVPAAGRWLPLPPIVNVTTPYELRRQLASLIDEPERLLRIRAASLAWAREVLSPEFTLAYWQTHLEDPNDRHRADDGRLQRDRHPVPQSGVV